MKVSVQRYKALDRLESELPAQLIHIGRTFTRHALWVMEEMSGLKEENNLEGFRFSLSKRQLANMIGCGESTAQRWTILATAIGLVTRLNEEEAEKIGEYRHQSGIGVQQYELNKINLREVRRNWNRWLKSGFSLRQVNVVTMNRIFNAIDIYKHPEAFESNRELREKRRDKVGIQATAQELMIHKNNKKIRLRLRELNRNQTGFWSQKKKEMVAPKKLSTEKYCSLVKRLEDMIDRVIFSDETKGLGVRLETVIRFSIQRKDISELIPTLKKIKMTRSESWTEYKIPHGLDKNLVSEILGFS